ncbi:MAG: integrase core domain-containing protein [Nitrospirales bacterium]|nr:integrase core domain-containing protein [Nitrospira sp.]MDR4484885.1 integrase core domain-containing protein [Nitrospirales bacterium]
MARSLTHRQVITVLQRLIARYGRPRYIRSDNGPEFIAQHLTTFLNDQEIIPSRIEPGKPWQKGSNESFNGTLRSATKCPRLFLREQLSGKLNIPTGHRMGAGHHSAL